MDEGTVDFWRAVPPDEESAEVAEPCDGAFNLPSLSVPSECAAVLEGGLDAVSFVRGNLFDAMACESFPQLGAVIGLVGNEAFGVLAGPSRASMADAHGAQRFVRERDFGGAGRVDGNSQRNTLAVCQYHKLCTLAAFGLSDATAPFFAGMNVPSMNASLQSRCSRLLSSVRKARQIFSHIPSFIHRWRRRQHVLGLGYRSGKSHHRAPVRNIHKIPSKHARLSAQGRPRLRRIGKCGSIFSHWASDKYTLRLMGFPPMNPYRQIRQNTL